MMPVNESSSSPLLKESLLQKPLEQCVEKRKDILSELRREPCSPTLQAYFDRLKEGSLTWDIDTFIEGIKQCATVMNQRAKKWEGLYYQSEFRALWNREYRDTPIT